MLRGNRFGLAKFMFGRKKIAKRANPRSVDTFNGACVFLCRREMI